MQSLFGLRVNRLEINPQAELLSRVVKELRRVEFLKRTVLEKKALEAGMDPYTLLLGILIGVAACLILSLFTVELWLPRAIARITGWTLEETRMTVMKILARG